MGERPSERIGRLHSSFSKPVSCGVTHSAVGQARSARGPEGADLFQQIDQSCLLIRLEHHIPADAKLSEVTTHLLTHPLSVPTLESTSCAKINFVSLSFSTSTTL